MANQLNLSAYFTLDSKGYFQNPDGKRIFSAGVNYWPASSGLQMWERWDDREIESDLNLIRDLGLNTIRFFLRWQDFEPEPGNYNEINFGRLDWLSGECARRGLLAHPSLFVGWMSGGIFWPEWKKDRNLFTDPFMMMRAEAFAMRAAGVFARHRSNLLAIDLGNEMDCLPESNSASCEDVAAWCRRVCAGVRVKLPGVLIVSGCAHGQVISDTPWSFGNQPGTDFYSMHAYPVPTWHPAALGGLSDPFNRRLFSFYCAYARAHGPTMFQEFGSFLTAGATESRDYLAVALPAVAAAGVNGMLWWCLHDIRSIDHPYGLGAMERCLGLVDSSLRTKPALIDAVRQLAGWARDPITLPATARSDLTLYIPEHTQPLGPAMLRHPNRQSRLGTRSLHAWHLAHEAGLCPAIVKAPMLPEPGVQPVLFLGENLSIAELEGLRSWVASGGRLFIHGMNPRNWGPEIASFLGADIVDYAHNGEISVLWAGGMWQFPPAQSEARFRLAPRTARVLARDQNDHPVMLTQEIGKGCVTYCLPSPEDAAAHDRRRSSTHGDRWAKFYLSLFQQPVAVPVPAASSVQDPSTTVSS